MKNKAMAGNIKANPTNASLLCWDNFDFCKERANFDTLSSENAGEAG
mgnify:CR=1 FL=1